MKKVEDFWKKNTLNKVILVSFIFMVISIMLGSSLENVETTNGNAKITPEESTKTSEDSAIIPEESAKTSEDSTIIPEESAKTSEDPATIPEESTKTSGGSQPSQIQITLGQKNALRAAKDYLDYSAFSYSGLIEQLEFEGYSLEDSTYGVDNCGADWFEQAYLSGQEYLDYSAFSRVGLIEQLEYEGFTSQQSIYAVDKIGL